ncbi:MAG: large subunit ribosomal protein L19 [Parcubacteria group bacterium Gr01-1014_3]|nr:MAG: large subunit ribosomal protein L19 [Parcubacteria group bacterium Gr01-1014_3]
MSLEVMKKIKSGAVVRVWEKTKDGDKERLSRFEGLVLARKHGSEPGATFTVRATVAGVGMEKVFPIHSPKIDKVEIISSPKKVSRSKIYYIRDLSKKQTRQKLGSSQEQKAATAKDKEVEKTTA